MNDVDRILDRLLREAHPAVEVSNDFTLRLWRKLLHQPAEALWKKVPVPAFALTAAVAVLAGLWTWNGVADIQGELRLARALGRETRWDLFGNAPADTLAGSVLKLYQNEPTAA